MALFITLVTLLLSCSNESKTPDLLYREPYASLTDSIHRFPQDPDLRYRRGVLLYRNGQKNEAADDIRIAWTLQPNETFGLSMVTILKEKHTDSAVLFLEKAIQQVPNSIALQMALARAYQSQQETEKAQAVADQILARHPGQIDALNLKSELVAEKDAAASVIYLEKAHHLVPSDPELAYNLAYAYATQRNNKLIQLTDSLIKAKAPELEKAWYTRGIYYENNKQIPQALAAYDSALQHNYNFADAYLARGGLQYELKDYTNALKTFELALRVTPGEPSFHYWKGKCLEALGKKEEAKTSYLAAYQLDKSNKDYKDAAGL